MMHDVCRHILGPKRRLSLLHAEAGCLIFQPRAGFRCAQQQSNVTFRRFDLLIWCG